MWRKKSAKRTQPAYPDVLPPMALIACGFTFGAMGVHSEISTLMLSELKAYRNSANKLLEASRFVLMEY